MPLTAYSKREWHEGYCLLLFKKTMNWNLFYTLYRYSTENVQVSGTVGVSGVHLCYYQKASKQLQIGVELEANHRMQEAVASIGYQVDLTKSEVVFKGIYFY